MGGGGVQLAFDKRNACTGNRQGIRDQNGVNIEIVCLCMCVCVSVCMYVHLCACNVYECVHICVYVCVCLYDLINTYGVLTIVEKNKSYKTENYYFSYSIDLL